MWKRLGVTICDWCAYTWSNVVRVQEASDLVLFVGVLIAVLLAWLGVANDSFNVTVAKWLSVGLGLWALLWLPFRRHQATENEHENAISALQQRLDVYTERGRPKLNTMFSKEIGACCVSNNSGSHYFRLVVVLKCHQGVTGCSGALTRVVRNSDGKVLLDHESVGLPFTPSHEADALNKTLLPDRPYYIDLLVVNDKSQQIQSPGAGGVLYFIKDKDGNRMFEEHDTYLLTINLAGVGIPTQIVQVSFKWKGNYSTAEYSKVE